MDCARGPRLDDLDIYHHIFVGKGLNNFNFYLFLLFSIFKLLNNIVDDALLYKITNFFCCKGLYVTLYSGFLVVGELLRLKILL